MLAKSTATETVVRATKVTLELDREEARAIVEDPALVGRGGTIGLLVRVLGDALRDRRLPTPAVEDRG